MSGMNFVGLFVLNGKKRHSFFPMCVTFFINAEILYQLECFSRFFPIMKMPTKNSSGFTACCHFKVLVNLNFERVTC